MKARARAPSALYGLADDDSADADDRRRENKPTTTSNAMTKEKIETKCDPIPATYLSLDALKGRPEPPRVVCVHDLSGEGLVEGKRRRKKGEDRPR